jgi:hypothetical protein
MRGSASLGRVELCRASGEVERLKNSNVISRMAQLFAFFGIGCLGGVWI